MERKEKSQIHIERIDKAQGILKLQIQRKRVLDCYVPPVQVLYALHWVVA